MDVYSWKQLQVEETADSSTVDFSEIFPLSRDTDGSCTAECVSGDWSAEVKQENLAVVKQEPDDVCCFFILHIQFITTERICNRSSCFLIMTTDGTNMVQLTSQLSIFSLIRMHWLPSAKVCRK